MSKGVIIHLDNDLKNVLIPSKELFNQMEIDLELIICQSEAEFSEVVRIRRKDIKVLIFDLLSSEPSLEEISGKDAEFLNSIKESFAKFNIPIFIFSGYLEAVKGHFTDFGSVYEIDKECGFKPILDKIKSFHDSGFLDIFCPSGILEKELLLNLHESFVGQFKADEIEKIIKSIENSTSPDNFKNRTIEVFKRIAVKSLMFGLSIPIKMDGDMVNPIEHFYRRNKDVPIWTGDIWKKKDLSETVFVLTPRCDLANHSAKNLIICTIDDKVLALKGNREKRIQTLRNHLTDNLLGKSTRYIPETPYLCGGFIDLSSHKTISLDLFIDQYEYHVTISDDFTNEIVGKFASYFLRTGILTIDPAEFDSYISQLEQVDV